MFILSYSNLAIDSSKAEVDFFFAKWWRFGETTRKVLHSVDWEYHDYHPHYLLHQHRHHHFFVLLLQSWQYCHSCRWLLNVLQVLFMTYKKKVACKNWGRIEDTPSRRPYLCIFIIYDKNFKYTIIESFYNELYIIRNPEFYFFSSIYQ